METGAGRWPQNLATLGISLVSGGAYYALGKLGLSLTFIHSSASPVWPPTGLAIGVLVVYGVRHWPAFFVGAYLFNFETSGDSLSSLLIALGNTLEGVVAATMINRWANGRAAFENMGATLRFLAFAGFAGPIVSATIGVGSLVATGLASSHDAVPIWTTWWLGNLAGAILIAPPIILWFAPPGEFPVRRLPGLRTVLSITGAAFAGIAAFFQESPLLLLLLIPALVWSLVRRDKRDNALVVLAISALAVIATVQGDGPFRSTDENTSLLLLQTFLASVAFVVLVASSGLSAAHGDRIPDPNRANVGLMSLVVVPLIAAATMSAAVIEPVADRLREDRRLEHAEVVAAPWRELILKYEGRLLSLRAFVGVGENSTGESFDEFVARTGWLDEPGLQAVSSIVVVAADQLGHYEQTIRSRGNPGFQVHPSPDNHTAYVVERLSPLAGNEAALGFDIGSESTRRAAIDSAIATGEAVATGPITLVQETGSSLGFLIVLPIVAWAGSDESPQESAPVTGFVTSVHRFEGMAESLPAAAYGLIDGGTRAELVPLPDGSGDSTTVIEIPAYGQTWELVVATPDDGLSATESGASWFVLGAGGLLSLSAGLVVNAYDSTRRRAKRIAKEMAGRLEEAQIIASLGNWTYDVGANMMDWSDEASRILGVQIGSRFGMADYVDLVHPDDRPKVMAQMQRAMKTGASYDVQHRIVRQGDVAWIHSRGRVTLDQGRVASIRGTIQDVTERVLMAEEQRMAREKLRDAAHMEEIHQFKSSFINTAAHELRTPLMPIQTQLFLLNKKRNEMPEEMRDHVDILVRNLDRLSFLIDDLLEASRFQAGRLSLTLEVQNVEKVIGDAVEAFHAAAMERDVRVSYTHSGEKEAVFDQQRMSQILTNLVSNAMKFTPSGGSIAVRSDPRHGRLRIEVRDTGVGIASEDLARLFRPFVQVGDSQISTHRGSGLGLYICKAIVELHSGTIEVRSDGLGKGTVFLINLPRTAVERQPTPQDIIPKDASRDGNEVGLE